MKIALGDDPEEFALRGDRKMAKATLAHDRLRDVQPFLPSDRHYRSTHYMFHFHPISSFLAFTEADVSHRP